MCQAKREVLQITSIKSQRCDYTVSSTHETGFFFVFKTPKWVQRKPQASDHRTLLLNRFKEHQNTGDDD